MAMYISEIDTHERYDFSNLKKETGFVINSSGYIQFVEAKIYKLLGYTQTELINKGFKDIMFDTNSINDLNYIPFVTKNVQLGLKHKQGHCVNVNVYFEFVHNLDTKSIEIYGTLIEIKKSNNFEAEFSALSRIVENSKDVLYRYSVIDNKLFYLSKSIFQLLGYMAEEFIEDYNNLLKIIHPDDLESFCSSYKNPTFSSNTILTRMRHSDGHYLWVEDCVTPIYSEKGTLIFIDGAYRDITDKIEMQKRLKYLTFHDALSGLYNRNYFEEEFNKLDNETDLPVAIILCDLDNLKIVNDTLGHDKGDQMITHVGKLLSSLIDENSFAARIGGDEFVLILKNYSYAKSMELVNNLILVVEEYNKCLINYTINMSIGSSYNEHSLNNMQRLFKMADNRMYVNKSIRKAL